MKPREKNEQNMLERHLGLFNTPPSQEMEEAEDRILRRLRSQPIRPAEELQSEPDPVLPTRKWQVMAALGVAAAIVVGFLVRIPAGRFGIDIPARVESADGGL